MESFGPFAWVGGVVLLVSDLVLPIPGTVVMSALGLVYGWFWGGIASVCGTAWPQSGHARVVSVTRISLPQQQRYRSPAGGTAPHAVGSGR